MAFRFRQFTVEDEKSALRVGTDAMLLGSWANPGIAKKILDIGTGCGVLALMMAQETTAFVEAIDSDQSSVIEARDNFLRSPWASRLSAIQNSIQSFSSMANSRYDFIIANPPYFSNSLKSPAARNNQTRHDDSLSLTDLVGFVSKLLADDGCFAVIMPSGSTEKFLLTCSDNRLYLWRRLEIYSKPDTQAKRTLMEVTKNHVENPECSKLTILDSARKYTPEYLTMTERFHNF